MSYQRPNPNPFEGERLSDSDHEGYNDTGHPNLSNPHLNQDTSYNPSYNYTPNTSAPYPVPTVNVSGVNRTPSGNHYEDPSEYGYHGNTSNLYQMDSLTPNHTINDFHEHEGDITRASFQNDDDRVPLRDETAYHGYQGPL